MIATRFWIRKAFHAVEVGLIADPEEILDSESSGIVATVSNYEVDETVSFTIQSGTGILSLITGTTCLFQPEEVLEESDTVIRATSNDDPSKFAEVTVTVTPTP